MRRKLQDLDFTSFFQSDGASSRTARGPLNYIDLPAKVAAQRSRSAASAFLFGSGESDDPFSQKLQPWNSKCPRWMPGYGTRSHGFCRKLKPLKKKWFPPEAPEPVQAPRKTSRDRSPRQTSPAARAAAAGVVGGAAAVAAVHHRRRPPPSNSPWEQPANEARQEQAKANTEQPQVPFTAPAAPAQRRVPPRPVRVPPPRPEEVEGDELAPTPKAPVPPALRARKKKELEEEDPFEPRPGLVIEAKSKPAPPSPDQVGTFEDDEPDEEKMMPPEAKSILKNELSKEGIEKAYEKERRESLPKEVPGSIPQGPFWPPPRTAPAMQPIPPRPGDTNYNYGWVPPEEKEPFSPPWPGGAPAVAVDRAEAVVEEVNDEANAVLKTAEDTLINTTV